jgi:predicted nucleotidyltransferase
MAVDLSKLPRAVEVLKSYGAKRILLFGSAAVEPAKAHDIDLAVEGIPLPRLLQADTDTWWSLDQPMDLVSKEEDPELYAVIGKYAKVLYDQAAA